MSARLPGCGRMLQGEAARDGVQIHLGARLETRRGTRLDIRPALAGSGGGKEGEGGYRSGGSLS